MAVAVYWQPGCTSCLRVRQFLADHGVAFESHNVLADSAARATLDRLGVRSVPVVTRGETFVFAQELDDVARFLGLPLRGARLAVPILAARVQGLLTSASTMAAALPADHLLTCIPGRDRSHADIAFHIGQIAAGFLDAARGGELTYGYFARRSPTPLSSSVALVDGLAVVSADFASWWSAEAGALPDTVKTYYGVRPLHQVLERTAWHMAQHCRQLQHILTNIGVDAASLLAPSMLDGLPLPRDVWDPEIKPVD